MRAFLRHSPALILLLLALPLPAQSPKLPLWAYPVAPAPPQHAPDLTPHTVPGSSAPAMLQQKINDLNVVPDWFPSLHPPMPSIVAVGRRPAIGACGHCHLPTGFGRPENQNIAGLSADYIRQQIADFKSGLRHSSDPRMGSVALMVQYSKRLTPDEITAAADYFSSIKPTPWIRVVETNTVPKSHPAGLMMVADPGTEPIGNRILELSENYEQTELRNPKSGFIAYVPVGSLKRGRDLVITGGNGRTIACTICHGANLRGLGNVPPIAGRSPSQLTRQLIDFQTGARNGVAGQLMKLPVAHLTRSDIVAITAYLASLHP